MYDLIGDLHGYADELVELLERMGYTERDGAFRHPDRSAIFCGDFIDRGPQIRETLRVVRSMVEAGTAQAVMGNHEFNAIAFHTERPDRPGEYFRVHSHHNLQQHRETLSQMTAGELEDALSWFRTLPVALDLDALRIVHACWDRHAIDMVEEAIKTLGPFSPEFLQPATTPGNPLFSAVERILKGPEIKLPEGVTVRDKEGRERGRIRIRWFEAPDGHTVGSYALPAVQHGKLLQEPLPAVCFPQPYGAKDPPVFIGHYWMPHQTPGPLLHNVACLDYSVARDGHLCGYRFHGESTLRAENFVSVMSRSRRSAKKFPADGEDFQRFTENARVNH